MNSNLIKILLVVLVFSFIFGWFGFKGLNLGTASIFTTEKTTETTITETTTTETVFEQVDLCLHFQPIIASGNLNAECNLMGGIWTCQDDYVGCSGTTVPIDCSGAGYNLVNYDCNSIGATYSCTPTEAYCAY